MTTTCREFIDRVERVKTSPNEIKYRGYIDSLVQTFAADYERTAKNEKNRTYEEYIPMLLEYKGTKAIPEEDLEFIREELISSISILLEKLGWKKEGEEEYYQGTYAVEEVIDGDHKGPNGETLYMSYISIVLNI
jgi:hypothetical protein